MNATWSRRYARADAEGDHWMVLAVRARACFTPSESTINVGDPVELYNYADTMFTGFHNVVVWSWQTCAIYATALDAGTDDDLARAHARANGANASAE
jgi:plastocyanin